MEEILARADSPPNLAPQRPRTPRPVCGIAPSSPCSVHQSGLTWDSPVWVYWFLGPDLFPGPGVNASLDLSFTSLPKSAGAIHRGPSRAASGPG